MFLVVSIVRFHRFKVMRVLYAFGRRMGDLRTALGEMEAWAKKSMGCRYMEAWVETGARERYFGRFGYKRQYTILRKPL